MSENEIQTPAEETVADVQTEASKVSETANTPEESAETVTASTPETPVADTATESASETLATDTATDEKSTSETPVAETATESASEPVVEEAKEEVPPEEISYHAVEKDGEITAIWEMQGQKHLRTINPRSTEGQKIFSLFTSDIHDTDTGATEEASA